MFSVNALRPARRVVMLLAAAPLLVTGCSVSVGDDDGGDDEVPSVETAELERRIKEGLAEELGEAPYPITIDCPDPLPAEVDATVRCVLEGGPDDLGITVKVTSVDDGRAQFDIDVDDEPL